MATDDTSVIDPTTGLPKTQQAKATPVPSLTPGAPNTNPVPANVPALALPASKTDAGASLANPITNAGGPPPGASAASSAIVPPSTGQAPNPVSALANPFDPDAWNARGGTAFTVDQSNALANPRNADQANIDAILGADGAYKAGGTWNGVSVANGIGDPFDFSTGKFINPTPGVTQNAGVKLDGTAVAPGTVLPQNAIDHSALTPGGTFSDGSVVGGPVNPLGGSAIDKVLGANLPAQGGNGLRDVGIGAPNTNLKPPTGAVLPPVGGLGAAPSVNAAPTLTKTDPNNPLTAQTISVDPGVNRFGVANQQLSDTIKNVLDPQFKADLLTADQHDFGQGRGISGPHRTSVGNIELAKKRDENQLASSFLNPALTGTIDDAYKNAGIAQQQQQFQAGQQGTAFNEATTAAQLQDALLNSATNRAATVSSVGEAGSPTPYDIAASGIYGTQAAQANAASGAALNAAGQKSTTPNYTQYLQQLMKQLGIAA